MAARWSDPPTLLPDIKVGAVTVRVQGRRHALVESRSHPGEWHTVGQEEDGTWVCTCKGWEIRKRCYHVDHVREWALGRISAEVVQPAHRQLFAVESKKTKGDT
jgi:hypothetical protein